MTFIEAAKTNSLEKLTILRKILKNDDATFTIVVGGSLARCEASDESDIDYFFFGDDAESIKRAKSFLGSKQHEISEVVGKPPSKDGAFGDAGCETLNALITDIGGNNDANEKITRRILFLLEGTWLTSEETFIKYRDAVLKRYVSEFIEPPHLCRFLLNDIIRYYRTICVDFEFKTVERNKEWGLRYIKLRYSRQILYFSGLIAVAETVGLDHDAKVNRLVELFNMTPIDRISTVCGVRADSALDLYNNFLVHISDSKIREALNSVTLDKGTHSDQFKELREKGRQFSLSLSKLLTATYGEDHLIHIAIIF